jgi:hypothetical protein
MNKISFVDGIFTVLSLSLYVVLIDLIVLKCLGLT